MTRYRRSGISDQNFSRTTGTPTRARKDGSAEKIAAAAARECQAYAEFDQISRACIEEMQGITGAGLDNLRRVLEDAWSRTVAGAAAGGVSCAADRARARAGLDQAVPGLLGAAGDLAGIAREFRAAADLAARLAPAV